MTPFDIRLLTIMFQIIGKYLVIFGLVLVAIGGIFYFAGRLPLFGKLPGDITIKRGNFTFYFPLTACILISIILSIFLYLFSKR